MNFRLSGNKNTISTASHTEVGRIGEDIAVKYLLNNGFVVIERNYRKKYGEIDIVAKKEGSIHFVEVKTVSCENSLHNNLNERDVHRPEDNIHHQKQKRLSRTIQAFLFEKFPSMDPEWEFHAITVRLDINNRRARVKFLENLIL